MSQVLKELGLWSEKIQRPLPWKQTANHNRVEEEVRPIFWRCRPNSYVLRTSEWNEFPNGRWGDSRAASFNDLQTYHLFYLKSKSPKADLLKMWGETLTSESDVWKVFENYITGAENEQGVKVIMSYTNTKFVFVWLVFQHPRHQLSYIAMSDVPKLSGETMTSVSAGHIILTLTQPVGCGHPQPGSNPGAARSTN